MNKGNKRTAGFARVFVPKQNLENLRNQKGAFLVELLVGVLVLSIVLGGLMQGLSQLHTQTTAPTNQMLASAMCQELFDMARNQSYNTLLANADSAFHQVIVNRETNGQTATGQPAYITQPLMLDMSTALGANYSTVGSNKRFRGTAEQRIDNLGGGQLRLTVRITWPSEMGGGDRQMQMDTRIFQSGIIN